MQEKDKKYILENIHKKSIKEFCEELGLKERKVRRFLEKEEAKKQTKDLLQNLDSHTLTPPTLKYNLSVVLVLLLAGFIIYSNTFFSPFHFDDGFSISDNLSIRHIQNLKDIWSFWPLRFITYLSLAFNYYFHRLDVLGYYVFNLAVHLGSSLLVWRLSLLTFSTPVMKEQKIARHAGLISFFAGLIFLTHPVQTQAVTYIIQRAASLAAFFYLVSLSLYVKSRLLEGSGRRIFYYIGSLLAAVLAMFTKEITITLPLMVCLYELL